MINSSQNSGESSSQQTNDGETDASFMEGGQLIKMSVRTDEERVLDQDITMDSSDSEAEENNKIAETSETPRRSEQESDGEIVDDAMDGQKEADDKCKQSRADVDLDRNRSPRLDRSDHNHHEQIRRIDSEMLKKTTELHGIMTSEGMTESAAMLSKCALEIEGKSGGSHQHHGNAMAEGMNFNTNATDRNKSGKSRLFRNGNNTINVNEMEFHRVNFGHEQMTRSDDTIYESAVKGWGSSSSEDDFHLNSSDEVTADKQVEFLITECREKTQEQLEGQRDTRGYCEYDDDIECGYVVPPSPRGQRGSQQRQEGTPPQPSTSTGQCRSSVPRELRAPEDKVQDMIQQAKNSKGRLFSTPGRKVNDLNCLLSPSVVVDEGYFVVGAHLDENTISKIEKGEYVDFGKLLPKDKIAIEEDCRFEMIIRNGKTFWTPASNSMAINSFARWEQAF